MLKYRDSIQMELNFFGSQQNIFRERIQNGEFQILAEIHAPSADTKLEHALQRNNDYAYVTAASKIPASLALIQTESPVDIMDPVQFLGELTKDNASAHLLYLPGRNSDVNQAVAKAKHALSNGIKNICAVSGSVEEGAELQKIQQTFFLESVNTLHALKESGEEELFCGATLNPYKYTPCDSSIQYFKAVKKVNCGAQFLVTQLGWDMMKLQEVQWNLWRRNINIPVFARLLYLTPETAADLCAGKMRGIHLSPDVEVLFRKELQYNSAQFQAVQFARLQLHILGAKMLGFSGVQIAGIDSPEILERILHRAQADLRENMSFEDWYEAYRSAYDRLNLAPYPYRYYLFDDLLKSAQPPEDFSLSNASVPPCTQKELLRKRLGELLFSHAGELPPGERKLTKKFLFSCRSCEKCRLPQTLYLCPELCPKGMSNGPCGSSKPDGSCPFRDMECIFSTQMRLADACGEYEKLENEYIETTGSRPLTIG